MEIFAKSDLKSGDEGPGRAQSFDRCRPIAAGMTNYCGLTQNIEHLREHAVQKLQFTLAEHLWQNPKTGGHLLDESDFAANKPGRTLRIAITHHHT